MKKIFQILSVVFIIALNFHFSVSKDYLNNTSLEWFEKAFATPPESGDLYFQVYYVEDGLCGFEENGYSYICDCHRWTSICDPGGSVNCTEDQGVDDFQNCEIQ